VEFEETELDTVLLDLQQREFMERRDDQVPGEAEYVFKHTLIQQTAYNSLLISRRKQLHCEVGEAIEALFPDALDEYAATLGFHFEQGGISHKAVLYLIRAGDAARAIYANAEAMTLYRTAIKQLAPLLANEEETQWADLATQLYEHLGDILALTGQNDAARRAYRDALVKAPPRDPLWSSRLYRKAGKAGKRCMAMTRRSNRTCSPNGCSMSRGEGDRLVARIRTAASRTDVCSITGEQNCPSLMRWQSKHNHWLNTMARRSNVRIFSYNWRTSPFDATGMRSLTNVGVQSQAVRASEEVDDLATLGWARFVWPEACFFAGNLDEAESYFQAALLIVPAYRRYRSSVALFDLSDPDSSPAWSRC
jgi:tetratricopeptide (TPR) repeat protein